MCKFTSSILRRIFCVSTCCVNVTWPCSLVPFIRFLSLPLFFAPLSNPPLKSTHRHDPLLRQQVKQNNSLCHTIAPLPCSRLWLLYSMTFSLSLSLSCSSVSSSSLVLNFFFFFHTNVTLIQQEPATVNCVTFLIVRWCCAVWSVSTLLSPIHQQRFVNVATFVWWESEVLRSYIFEPMCWNLSTLDSSSAATARYVTHHWTGKKAFFKTQFYCTKCFIVFTKYI